MEYQFNIGDLVTTTVLGIQGSYLVLDISRTGLCLAWNGMMLWKFKTECKPVGQNLSENDLTTKQKQIIL